MRRNILHLAVPAILLVLFTTSLYLGREQLSRISMTHFLGQGATTGKNADNVTEGKGGESGKGVEDVPKPAPIIPVPVANGTILISSTIAKYVDAIFTGKTTELPYLQCPVPSTKRYKSLRVTETSTDEIRYFFSLNLRNNVNLLPRLIGSVVEAMRFLGPQHCALSIVEGNSPDGTADVLKALRPGIEAIGATYFFETSDIDPSKGNRIGRLAKLRNMALQPLFDHADRASNDTTVLFLNDVSACTEDILELAYQRRVLGADMTCAMDWTYPGDSNPNFYDVWIARGLKGDTFFEIGSNGNWGGAGNLFWNEPKTQARFQAHRPFQVFACWNGATAFGAGPLLDEKVKLRFRTVNAKADECFQGEPELFCKDMWFHGYGKIAVIPAVSLEYSIANGKRLKAEKGFTSQLVEKMDAKGDKIKWQEEAPTRVKCMPSFDRQTWRAWNETLKKEV